MMLFWNDEEEGKRKSISVVQNSRSKWLGGSNARLEWENENKIKQKNSEMGMDATL